MTALMTAPMILSTTFYHVGALVLTLAFGEFLFDGKIPFLSADEFYQDEASCALDAFNLAMGTQVSAMD